MNTQPLRRDPFFSALEQHPETALVFKAGDTKVNPGYHITEIKQTKVSSIDCGRGSDDWEELVIQVLDGSPSSKAGYMSVDKFLGITGSAPQNNADQKLFFEFSPGNGPLLKLSASEVTSANNETVVHLDTLAAECKPLTRFIASGRKGCCC